jgi:uncharacterized protein YlzI (FlbEa/FlbD family)
MIKLTDVTGRTVYVNPDHIVLTYKAESGGTVLGTTIKELSGLVQESPEEVIAAIEACVPAWAQHAINSLEGIRDNTCNI